MWVRAVAAALFAISVAACDERMPEEPTRIAPPATRDALFDLKQRIGQQRRMLEERLHHLAPLPKHFAAHCPDADIRRMGLDDAARSLVITTEDARYEKRFLIPLALTSELTSDDLMRLEQRTESGDELGAPLGSSADAERVLQKLTLLGRHRFEGVFRVIDYGSPQLVHKLGKARAEWNPGYLVSNLIVYDLESREPICKAQIQARNDVTGAPITQRMKSVIRERMIQELGTLARAEATRALAKLSTELTLPEPPEPKYRTRPSAELAQR